MPSIAMAENHADAALAEWQHHEGREQRSEAEPILPPNLEKRLRQAVAATGGKASHP